MGGAAAAVLAIWGIEKGKQMLNAASGVVKDLTGKATEFAKKFSRHEPQSGYTTFLIEVLACCFERLGSI